jgi:4-cresol dehydrogenase (hydroxylating)
MVEGGEEEVRRKRMKLSLAIGEWKRVVGASGVSVSARRLKESASATYGVSNRVAAIVQPRNRAEVQQCVGIATRNHVPIYPISGGKNFGYGSGAPTQDGSVILDLSLMNRLHLDRDLAAVTVEPGVTNAALAKYIAKHAPELVASLPGGTSPKASPMGNALDGGVGSGAYNDRFAHVYSMEVVLGSGEVIRTGLDRFQGGAALGHTEARVGPSLRELFMQSNFGVVTSMTFGLFPMPEDLRLLVVHIDADRLATFLERMRPLLRAGVLTSMFSLHNDTFSAMSLLGDRYPWALAHGRAPLPKEILHRLRDALGDGFPAWRASIDLLSVDRSFGDARERAIRRALSGFDITTTHVSRATRQQYWLPEGTALSSVYWRKPEPPPEDVNDIDFRRDQCGLLWCDFVLPMDGSFFAKIVPRLELLVRSYGFEPTIEAHTFWPRAIFLIVVLHYDRAVPGADMRAEKCDRAMTAYLSPLGVMPSRRRVGSMDLLAPTTDDSAAVFARIRKTLDPSGVIAPGRYDAVTARQQRRLAKKPIRDKAFDAAEAIHLSLIAKWSESEKKIPSNGTRPLRPHFMAQAVYTKAQDAARALLPALTAGAQELVTRTEWRGLLEIDDELARALHKQLDPGPALGKLEGAFDSEGEYRVFGFSSSIGSVQQSVALAEKNSRAGWRSTISRSELRAMLRRTAGHTIGVVRSARSRELAGFIKEHARKHIELPNTAARISSSGRAGYNRLDALYAVGWKDLLADRFGGKLRATILENHISTNAAADLVLSNLALLALLTDPNARPRLKPALADAVDRHLPWTRVLQQKRTTYRGKTIDLPSFVRDNPESFVLRPIFQTDEPALFGAFVTPGAWTQAIRRALRGRASLVVQERVHVQQEVFPLACDGLLEFEGCFVATELMIVGGDVAKGSIVRIGERPSVGARSARTYLVPALVEAASSVRRSVDLGQYRL